jgi:hypothetical protein
MGDCHNEAAVLNSNEMRSASFLKSNLTVGREFIVVVCENKGQMKNEACSRRRRKGIEQKKK